MLSIGPLRSTFAALPLVPFLGTLFLLMVPGAVLVRWFFGEHLSGVVVVPVSFALGVGIFTLLGVPFLMLHQRLEAYLWVSGTIVAASLVASAGAVFRRKASAGHSVRVRPSVISLWAPFALLSAALASLTQTRVPPPYNDIWVYLAWVREFLNADRLALREPYFGHQIGTSRAQINGWLLEQAALSKVSGIDSIELVLGYLAPVLVVMSLLAFYALARALLKSETAALLVGSLYALGSLVQLAPRWYLVGRIAEDKFVSWFLFLPVGLIFAFLFVQTRKWRYLMVFAFCCWAVVAIHPVGLALIGLCTAGFGLFHLALDLRNKRAWIETVSLGGALLSVLLAPLLYLLVTGDSLVATLKSADISAGDPEVLANMVFVKEGYENRLLELGETYYMVDPARVLRPAMLVAFLVGLPFLLWRIKRGVGAQLLAGMLLAPVAVCFVPPVATFFGNHIILPGQMWRLMWPIPLAAFLVIGWMVWEVVRYAQIGLSSSGSSRRIGRFLPLALVCTSMVAAAPGSVDDAKALYRAVGGEQNSGSCLDPIFGWMQNNIEHTSVVLAPDSVNTCIPAYSAEANVVSLRGALILADRAALERRAPGQIDVPQGALDVRSFFSRSTPKEKVRILRRQEVDYVMVRADSPLNGTLTSQPGLGAISTPGERYHLYMVDRERLVSDLLVSR